jgi:serine/threonine protein kinase
VPNAPGTHAGDAIGPGGTVLEHVGSMTNKLPSVGVEDADPLLGQELSGTYRIVRQIGAGGMGSVYEAHHVRLPKKVAIKVMLPEVAADQASFERFRREAETTSSLGNAHIAEVIDFNFLPNGAPYMVMEYLLGEDLGTRLESRERLPPAQVAAIIRDVASALASAHAGGIFHRDIKPANIFFARQEGSTEVVKLLDFGAAKSQSSRNLHLTMTGQVVGTPWYMSPEQARGMDLDARSDQFSLALVAYEGLTRRLPFDGAEPQEVLFRIVDDPYEPIRTHAPELSEGVEAVFARAFAKDPAGRYESVTQFAAALGQALVVAPSAAASASLSTATLVMPALVVPTPSMDVPASPDPSTTGGRSRRSARIVGALGALIALGLAGVLYLARSRHGAEPEKNPAAPVPTEPAVKSDRPLPPVVSKRHEHPPADTSGTKKGEVSRRSPHQANAPPATDEGEKK